MTPRLTFVGTLLLVALLGNLVRPQTFQATAFDENGLGITPTRVNFLFDGSIAVTGSFVSSRPSVEGLLRIMIQDGDDKIHRLSNPERFIFRLRAAQSEPVLAYSTSQLTRHYKIAIRNLEKGSSLQIENAGWDFDLSQSGRFLAFSEVEIRKVRVRDLEGETAELLLEPSIDLNEEERLAFGTPIVFSPDETLLAVAGNRELIVWDLQSGKIANQFRHEPHDEEELLERLKSFNVRDIPSGETFPHVVYKDISGLAFAPAGDWILSVRNKETVEMVALSELRDGIYDSFRWDSHIAVWDVVSGALERSFTLPFRILQTAVVSDRILVIGTDREVIFLDIETQETLAEHPLLGAAQSLSVSPIANRIAVTDEKQVLVLDFHELLE